MIDKWLAILFVVALGILFDQAIVTIARSQQVASVRMLLITFVNNAMLFCVLALSYYVDGFTMHGALGMGWLDWTTVAANFFIGYGIMSFFTLWRVVKEIR